MFEIPLKYKYRRPRQKGRYKSKHNQQGNQGRHKTGRQIGTLPGVRTMQVDGATGKARMVWV